MQNILTKIRNWALENRGGVTVLLTVVALTAAFASLNGCGLSSLIKVSVPSDVASATGTGTNVTLADAAYTWTEWSQYVKRNTTELADSLATGEAQLEVLSSVTNMGLGALQENAGSFPGGALVVSALSLLGGLFLRKPGDTKRNYVEKEDSYNAGLREGKRLAMEDA
jgi:hypothetical protein